MNLGGIPFANFKLGFLIIIFFSLALAGVFGVLLYRKKMM